MFCLYCGKKVYTRAIKSKKYCSQLCQLNFRGTYGTHDSLEDYLSARMKDSIMKMSQYGRTYRAKKKLCLPI